MLEMKRLCASGAFSFIIWYKKSAGYALRFLRNEIGLFCGKNDVFGSRMDGDGHACIFGEQ